MTHDMMHDDNRCIDIHISEPVAWIAAFRRAAQADGMTLSEWIGEACLQRLGDERNQLPPRPSTGRPKRSPDNNG